MSCSARIHTRAENGISTKFEYGYDLGGRLVTVARNGALEATYVYDENGTFRWADDYTGKLDNFQFLSGNDAQSSFCAPAFVSAARGDLHLSPLDTCLKDAGVDASDFIQVDIDDEPRGQGAAWDAGADELPADVEATPAADGDSAGGDDTASEPTQ